ncbi:MAG: hypothetical protein GX766_01120 [Firmicutes bacterium]|jgi:predicted  nucleic acid-binding Zn-ribbon protein|nr:hypothetical protein [Bacillota bacterium]HQD39115.1 hypothetical protein [Bacillota bacterium]
MLTEAAKQALDRILAAEYSLLESYERIVAEEGDPLFAEQHKLCQEMTAELSEFLSKNGSSPRQTSGVIGIVFRLGDAMATPEGEVLSLTRQIKLAIEEKYRLLSKLPPEALAIVERHLGQERQMLLELEQMASAKV